MAPAVAVAIVAVGNADLLEQSLASLREHAGGEPPFEVVIVLNGATDDVRACVTREAPDALVVDSPVNLGTGGGFNRAFAATDAPYMVIAHDDSQVTPGWLTPLVRRMEEDPSVGAVGGRIEGFDGHTQVMGGLIFRDGTSHPEWAGGAPPPDLVTMRRDVDYHGGLGLLIRRRAWDAVGGFDDTSYYPGYYPDADLCFALRAAGWRVRYEPDSVILHHGGRSTTAPFREFIARSNREAFAARHADDLAAHGPARPGDAVAVAAEVQRMLVTAVPDRAPAAVPDPAAAALLRDRLARPDLEYLRMERDVWRRFATHQTARLDAVRDQVAATDASRRSWQQVARVAGEDRDRWRARAADISAHAADVTDALGRTGDALERTTDALVTVTGSGWWRLGRRARRLLGRP